MDMGSDATMDIYFETTYMGKSIKTDYVTASKASAIIDQELWIPVQLPLTIDRLTIKVRDHNTLIKDGISGTILFKMKDLIANS